MFKLDLKKEGAVEITLQMYIEAKFLGTQNSKENECVFHSKVFVWIMKGY